MQDAVRDVILPAVLAPLESLGASKTTLCEYTKRFDEFITAASRLSCCTQEVSRYLTHQAWRMLIVDPNKQQLLSMISGEVLNLLQHLEHSKAEIINRTIDSILCGTSSCKQVSNGSIGALIPVCKTDTFLIPGWSIEVAEQTSSSEFLVEFHRQLVAANPSIDDLFSLVRFLM